MSLVAGALKKKTLAPDGSHQSFAERIRGGRSYWRFQDAHTEVSQRRVDIGRENAIAIVDQESIRMVKCQELAELLDGPFRRGCSRHCSARFGVFQSPWQQTRTGSGR